MATKPKTTDIAVKAATNIVSLKEAMAAQIADIGNRTQPASGSAIRITQDKQFALPDGTKTPGPLQLVVVDFASKNVYYETGFDPKNIVPPNCFAMGSNPLKLIPSARAPDVQAKDCASCSMNAFGSKGKGKACSNTRVLAVLPPDANADTPMWLLSVSATAVKGFDGFVGAVARVFQTPPVGVVVTVGFNPNETYAQLTFSDPQANVNLTDHFARQAEAQTMLAVEPDVSKFVKPTRGRVTAGARR